VTSSARKVRYCLVCRKPFIPRWGRSESDEIGLHGGGYNCCSPECHVKETAQERYRERHTIHPVTNR
jgi:hypothetical protein